VTAMNCGLRYLNVKALSYTGLANGRHGDRNKLRSTLCRKRLKP
jgi:hypothetical protein